MAFDPGIPGGRWPGLANAQIGYRYDFGYGEEAESGIFRGIYNGAPVLADAHGRMRAQGGKEVMPDGQGGFKPLPLGSYYGDGGSIQQRPLYKSREYINIKTGETKGGDPAYWGDTWNWRPVTMEEAGWTPEKLAEMGYSGFQQAGQSGPQNAALAAALRGSTPAGPSPASTAKSYTGKVYYNNKGQPYALVKPDFLDFDPDGGYQFQVKQLLIPGPNGFELAEYNGEKVITGDWGELSTHAVRPTIVVQTPDGKIAPMPKGSAYGDQGIINYWAKNPAPAGSSSIPGAPGGPPLASSTSRVTPASPFPGMVYDPQKGTYVTVPTVSDMRYREGGEYLGGASGFINLPKRTVSQGGETISSLDENPPSNGPDISLTFPGYYNVNANVEEQYAQWRDERRANGEDPYDMNAFRQHLIAIGAADPGAPKTSTTTTPTPPGTTPTPVVPPVNNAPPPGPPPPQKAPAGSAPPGYSLGAGTPRSGTAQDILSSIQMPNIPNVGDVRRLFPWLEDPKSAAATALEQGGFNLAKGNPFTSYLQNQLPRFANIARIQDILGGGAGREENIQAAIPRALGGGITSASGQGLIPQLAALARRASNKDTQGGLTEHQKEFTKQYLTNAEDVVKFISGLSDVAPDLRSARQALDEENLRQYRNMAGGTGTNKSIWDFLGF